LERGPTWTSPSETSKKNADNLKKNRAKAHHFIISDAPCIFVGHQTRLRPTTEPGAMGQGARVCSLLGASAAHVHRAARVQCVKQMSTFKSEGQRVRASRGPHREGTGKTLRRCRRSSQRRQRTSHRARLQAMCCPARPKSSGPRPGRCEACRKRGPPRRQVISDPSDFVDSD